MSEIQSDDGRDLKALAGSFIETAFSAEQVARAVLHETRIGGQEEVCAFLFSAQVNAAPQA